MFGGLRLAASRRRGEATRQQWHGGGAAAAWRRQKASRWRHGGVTAGHDSGATLRRRRHGGGAVAPRWRHDSTSAAEELVLAAVHRWRGGGAAGRHTVGDPPPSPSPPSAKILPSHLPTAGRSSLTRRQYRRRGPKPDGSSCAKMLAGANEAPASVLWHVDGCETNSARLSRNTQHGVRWQPT